jgi:hypothetical protein
MSKSEKPSPHVMISARDLRDIAKDELYGIGSGHIMHDGTLHPEEVKRIAKTIVKRALLSPKPSG